MSDHVKMTQELLFGPMEVGDRQVTFALVQDPNGAAFGLMQSRHG